MNGRVYGKEAQNLPNGKRAPTQRLVQQKRFKISYQKSNLTKRFFQKIHKIQRSKFTDSVPIKSRSWTILVDGAAQDFSGITQERKHRCLGFIAKMRSYSRAYIICTRVFRNAHAVLNDTVVL